jgi:hypothetical protein
MASVLQRLPCPSVENCHQVSNADELVELVLFLREERPLPSFFGEGVDTLLMGCVEANLKELAGHRRRDASGIDVGQLLEQRGADWFQFYRACSGSHGFGVHDKAGIGTLSVYQTSENPERNPRTKQ